MEQADGMRLRLVGPPLHKDESRRKRGASKRVTRYDLAYRVGLVRGMARKLRPAEKKSKEEQTAALAKEKKAKEKMLITGS